MPQLHVRGSIWMLLILFSAAVSLTQPTVSSAADVAGVQQASKNFRAALERRDIKAVEEFWTPEGTYTDEHGQMCKAHDLLANNLISGTLASSASSIGQQKVHFVTDDVAIENAECEIAVANGLPSVRGCYTAVWVHQNGRWKLDNLQEVRLTTPPAALNNVSSLGVLVGEWSGETPQGKIHISAKWDSGKKFLRRDFSLSNATSPLSGTQEIGWDPATEQIKSWIFHDDGSFGEGVWNLEDVVWVEGSWRICADGRTVKATQVYKFPDRNTIIWKLIRGSIEGQPVQSMEVVLKRSNAAE